MIPIIYIEPPCLYIGYWIYILPPYIWRRLSIVEPCHAQVMLYVHIYFGRWFLLSSGSLFRSYYMCTYTLEDTVASFQNVFRLFHFFRQLAQNVLVQKRHITDWFPSMTHWSKNLMSLTHATERPFRCLDIDVDDFSRSIMAHHKE